MSKQDWIEVAAAESGAGVEEAVARAAVGPWRIVVSCDPSAEWSDSFARELVGPLIRHNLNHPKECRIAYRFENASPRQLDQLQAAMRTARGA